SRLFSFLITLSIMREKSSTRKHVRAIAGGMLIAETAATWIRSGRLAGNLIVRCRDRHLFTTLWIPGASVKALRLGPWRVQRCPVGRDWTVVTPVRDADLSRRRRLVAKRHHDIRIP